MAEEELGRVYEYQSASLGKLGATPRKLLAHGFVHSTRHWAQIAAAVRAHGYPTDWQHDVLFSTAVK